MLSNLEWMDLLIGYLTRFLVCPDVFLSPSVFLWNAISPRKSTVSMIPMDNDSGLSGFAQQTVIFLDKVVSLLSLHFLLSETRVVLSKISLGHHFSGLWFLRCLGEPHGNFLSGIRGPGICLSQPLDASAASPESKLCGTLIVKQELFHTMLYISKLKPVKTPGTKKLVKVI